MAALRDRNGPIAAERHAAQQTGQTQIERQDAADQQADAGDVRGIDEQIDRARALQQDGTRPGAEPLDERHRLGRLSSS